MKTRRKRRKIRRCWITKRGKKTLPGNRGRNESSRRRRRRRRRGGGGIRRRHDGQWIEEEDRKGVIQNAMNDQIRSAAYACSM